MDAPRSKRMGAPRFSGEGATSAKPGTARWYKQHVPERFNNTKIQIRNTGGYSDRDCETIAARVLSWNERQHDHHENHSMIAIKANPDTRNE